MKIKLITLFYYLAILCALFLGIWIGMLIQQQMFIVGAYEFAKGLEGTSFELNIDLNETIMVEKMGEILRESFRSTGDVL